MEHRMYSFAATPHVSQRRLNLCPLNHLWFRGVTCVADHSRRSASLGTSAPDAARLASLSGPMYTAVRSLSMRRRAESGRHSGAGSGSKDDINLSNCLEEPSLDFPAWLEDQLQFSKRETVPVMERKGFFQSLWPIKALSRSGSKKYGCEFYLHVHGADSLPAATYGNKIVISTHRKDWILETRPTKIRDGVAEVEQTLKFRSTLYSVPGSSPIIPKFTPKGCTVIVTILGEKSVEVGRHVLDLAKILPTQITANPAPWTTTLALSGRAKGGSVVVTIGYLVQLDKGIQLAAPVASHTFAASMSCTPIGGSTPRSQSTDREGMEGPGAAVKQQGMEATNESPPAEPDVREAEESKEVGQAAKASGGGAGVENAEPTDGQVEKQKNEDETAGSAAVELWKMPIFGDILSLIQSGEYQSEKMVKGGTEDLVRGGVETEGQETVEAEPHSGGVAGDARVGGGEGNSDHGVDRAMPGVMLAEDRTMAESEGSKEEPLTPPPLALAVPQPHPATPPTATLLHHLGLSPGPSEVDETDPVAQEFLEMLGGSEEEEQFFLSTGGEMPETGNAIVDSAPLAVEGYESGVSGGVRAEKKESEVAKAVTGRRPRTKRLNAEELLAEEEKLLLGFQGGGGMVTTVGMVVSDKNADLDQDLAELVVAGEAEKKRLDEAKLRKVRTRELEDEETAALMQRFGVSKDAFELGEEAERSRGREREGTEIRVVPTELPSLGEGVGPAVHTKDGGMLLTMMPDFFSPDQGHLVMQVSKPVVVPAGLGSTATEIMQHLASIGAEALTAQAHVLMPLEDVSGKPMSEILRDSLAALEGDSHTRDLPGYYRPSLTSPQPQSETDLLTLLSEGTMTSVPAGTGMVARQAGPLARVADRYSSSREEAGEGLPVDFVTLDELAPLAISSIEQLAMQGLKIQSDMAEEEPPSTVQPTVVRQVARLEGSGQEHNDLALMLAHGRGEMGGETSEMDLMGMSVSVDEWERLDAISPDEWMALDSDEFEPNQSVTAEEVEGEVAEIVTSGARGASGAVVQKDRGSVGEGGGGGGGSLGNSVTLVMLVQLRDPLRNFEAVGAPMMAIIQAERVLVPPPVKLGRQVALQAGSKEEAEEEVRAYLANQTRSHFKLTGVHMMGLKGEEAAEKGWGTVQQAQAGSRWLLAEGMGKGKGKSTLLKKQAKAKAQKGETLWGISQKVHGDGRRWKDLAKLNPHVRNPDVLLPDQMLLTR